MTWTKPTASTTARGYGGKHQKLRKQLLAKAYGQPCCRCGRPMLPGQALHLDHNDQRTGYLGFSHSACNREAGARKARQVRAMRKGRRVVVDLSVMDTSREW